MKKTLCSLLIAMCASILAIGDDHTSFMQKVDQQKYPFMLPALPYAYDALEPYIDTRTMEIHHDRHHGAYVDHLNKAMSGTKWQGMTMRELFAQGLLVPAGIRNNAGGHWNHSFFWSIMASPGKKFTMSERLQKEIERTFGSVEAFKTQFRQSGLDRLGSGWTWLIRTRDGTLKILSTPNQDNPLMDFAEVQGAPILTCDVWEHAYYLKYLNRRDTFMDAFWNLVHWQRVDTLAYPE